MKSVSNSGISNKSHYSGSESLSQRKLVSYMWGNKILTEPKDKTSKIVVKSPRDQIKPEAKTNINQAKPEIGHTEKQKSKEPIINEEKKNGYLEEVLNDTNESINIEGDELDENNMDWDLIRVYNAKIQEDIDKELEELSLEKKITFRKALDEQIKEKLFQIENQKRDKNVMDSYLKEFNERKQYEDSIEKLKKLKEREDFKSEFLKNLEVYRLKKKALKRLKKKEKAPTYILNDEKIIEAKIEDKIRKTVMDRKLRQENFEQGIKRKAEKKTIYIKSQADFLEEARRYNRLIEDRRSQEIHKREMIKENYLTRSELAFSNYNPDAHIDRITHLQDRLLLKQARDDAQKHRASSLKAENMKIDAKDRIMSYQKQIEAKKKLAEEKKDEMRDIQQSFRRDYTEYINKLKEAEIEKKAKMIKYREELLRQIEEDRKKKNPQFKKLMNNDEMKINSSLVSEVKKKLGNQRYN